jgi:hypothetical protein
MIAPGLIVLASIHLRQVSHSPRQAFESTSSFIRLGIHRSRPVVSSPEWLWALPPLRRDVTLPIGCVCRNAMYPETILVTSLAPFAPSLESRRVGTLSIKAVAIPVLPEACNDEIRHPHRSRSSVAAG